MDLYVDYETICVNCKEKGYLFGYTFKTIEYLGKPILDIPSRYLNGPCLTFNYKEIPMLIRSLENSHHLGVAAQTPIFTMINAKRNQDNSISRFTYIFSPDLHPEIIRNDSSNAYSMAKIVEYVDMYRYPDKPYLLLFYSYRNSTSEPLNNFQFYNFYDFDIMGQDQFDSDIAIFDPNLQFVYQYDFDHSVNQDLYAGFGSTKANPPSYFECNTSQVLMIASDRLKLRNIPKHGPDDCAVGLQWDIGTLGPGQLQIFPIMLVAGYGEENFKKNLIDARKHLEKLVPNIYNAVNGKFRQLIDPELEKMSFSTKEWCKED